MAEIFSDPDDTPLTKEIKVFNVKETLNSKNLYNNNHKSVQPSPLKSTMTDQIPSVENDIKLEEADINQIEAINPKELFPMNQVIDSNYYIHCKCCLLVLSTENKLQSENGRFYLITQPISPNILEIPKEYKTYAYKELLCKRCRMLIGTIFIEGIARMTYFIKKKVSPREMKKLTVKLLGLRTDLLSKIQGQLVTLFNDYPKVVIDISKQTKESLEKFKYQKDYCDMVFIVHKIEGRVFLLGKNGFYNEVIKEFCRKNNKNIYFVLLFKEVEEKFNDGYCNEIIDDLINKGGQDDLRAFKEEKRILCINDLVFGKDFQAKSHMFRRLYDDNYIIYKDDDDDSTIKEKRSEEYYKSNNEHSDKDKEVINDYVEYFYEGKNKLFANCSML